MSQENVEQAEKGEDTAAELGEDKGPPGSRGQEKGANGRDVQAILSSVQGA